ncbi:hypothetical protein QFC19_006160 [Naganishia cerealis]|uniref:Uncharacterized protein n=1 Tax=Naganishia cerealis TaxID=610337 RepID=A0ACC2VK02_9TREE|nr:hypothetical protein QFC19_006160 [Naganishia cerealis]
MSSLIPQSAIKQKPAQRSTNRRSSSIHSSLSRQSLAPGSKLSSSGTTSTLGGRNLKHRETMDDARDDIRAFLHLHRVPLILSPSTLDSPTSKEFHAIFRALAEFIDRDFRWGVPGAGGKTGSWEADVLEFLRQVRYPLVSEISKTALAAPGSSNNWPPLLGMLHWLTSLASALQRWTDPLETTDPTLLPPHQFSPQLIEQKPELWARLLADFVLRAYRVWLGGDEAWPELENEVAGKFEEIMRADEEQWQRLMEDKEQLEAELNLLKCQEPPLERLRKEETNLKGDQAKFLNWIKIHEEKSKKMEDGNGKLREALRMEDEKIESLQHESGQLKAEVDAQGITQEQVAKMNSDKASLSEAIRQLKHIAAEQYQALGSAEINWSRKMDDVDNLVGRYNDGTEKIAIDAWVREMRRKLAQQAATDQRQAALLASLPEDLLVQLEMAGQDPAPIHALAERLRAGYARAYEAYAQAISDGIQESVQQKIELLHRVDTTKNAVAQTVLKAGNKEHELRGLENEIRSRKQLFAKQSEVANTRMRELEAEIHKMSMNGEKELMALKIELERLRIRKQEVSDQAKTGPEKMMASITGHLQVILQAKEHIEGKILEVKKFASSTR